MTPDEVIQDELLAYSLDLQRFTANQQADILAILMELERALTAELAGEVTEYRKAEIERLIAQAHSVIDQYFSRLTTAMEVDGLAALTGQQVVSALNKAIPALGANLPGENVWRALLQDLLIQGHPARDWWKRQSDDLKFRYSAVIRQGVASGKTSQQMVREIAGRRGEPGIMDISRRNATSLVATSIQTIASEARMATYRENSDIIKGLRWVTALDGHVCNACAARADHMWSLDGKPLDNDIEFKPVPLHFGDRCVLVPVTKSYKELGINLPEPGAGSRGSRDGQVDGRTTFDAFLRRKGTAFQDEVLGVGRADLWRRGKITLAQLVDGRGRELTLEQLRSKYGP